MMTTVTQADLANLSEAFEQRTPDELLRWAAELFGTRVAALSAMQLAGSVVCHMLSELKLQIPVLFVDTGVHFQETLETRDRIMQEYGVKVITLSPELTMAEQVAKYGVLYLTSEGQTQCCQMRKSDPLIKVKGQYDLLIGSLRRADGGRRGSVPVLSIDPEMSCLRLNPLANFSDEDLERYLKAHPVIVNPLHQQGFSTIGCNRCTTPVLPHEPKRAGRWRHLGPWSMYCGINPTDVDGGTSTAIKLPQELAERLLGRSSDFFI